MKNKTIPIICIFILLLYVGAMMNNASLNSENPYPSNKLNRGDLKTENASDGTESQSSVEINYTGHKCAECRNRCIDSREISSKGDILSNYKPYYLCGDMDCIEKRYDKILSLQSGKANSDYSVGKDGQIYESEKCGLCNGTGIERSAYHGESRVCPLCDGRGKQNY